MLAVPLYSGHRARTLALPLLLAHQAALLKLSTLLSALASLPPSLLRSTSVALGESVLHVMDDTVMRATAAHRAASLEERGPCARAFNVARAPDRTADAASRDGRTGVAATAPRDRCRARRGSVMVDTVICATATGWDRAARYRGAIAARAVRARGVQDNSAQRARCAVVTIDARHDSHRGAAHRCCLTR